MYKVREEYDWMHVAQKLAYFYKYVLKVNERYDSEKTKSLYVKAYSETPRYV